MLRRPLVLLLTATMVATVAVQAAAETDPTPNLAIAKQALLSINDFPSGEGWTQQTRAKTTRETLPSCQPIERAKAKYKKFRVESPEFGQRSNTSADNTVYVLPTVKDAKAFFAAYKRPTEQTCLRKSTEERLTSKDATLDIARIDASGIGDDGVGFVLTVTAPTVLGRLTGVIDALAYRVGRAIIGFAFRNADSPLDIQQDLVAAAVGRLVLALTPIPPGLQP